MKYCSVVSKFDLCFVDYSGSGSEGSTDDEEVGPDGSPKRRRRSMAALQSFKNFLGQNYLRILYKKCLHLKIPTSDGEYSMPMVDWLSAFDCI